MRTETKFFVPLSVACALTMGACMFELPEAREKPAALDASQAPADATADTFVPVPVPDAGPPPGLDAGKITAPCPEAGAVRVGQGTTSFCVDGTEVTDQQFLDFMNAGGPEKNQVGTPPQCFFNLSNGPPLPPAADSLPVVNVNWCDAYAFCAWAGKHLCGTPRGEWLVACSHDGDGQHTYPYGNAFDRTACNAGNVLAALAPVATNTRCLGGYPGLFDLTGNAAEWEDACDDDAGVQPGQDSLCNVRGGAFDDDPRDCKYVAQLARQTRAADVGFRCCF